MKGFIGVVLLLGFFECSAEDIAQTKHSYRYTSWFGDLTLSIREPTETSSRGQIVVGDDAFFQADFCEPQSEYHCFFSTQFAFAVPKHIKPSEKEWAVRSVKFELVRHSLSVSVFGRRFDDLFLIRSPAEATITGRELDEARLYLYSKRYGIVGMTAGDSLAAYWLETDHGAFADED